MKDQKPGGIALLYPRKEIIKEGKKYEISRIMGVPHSSDIKTIRVSSIYAVQKIRDCLFSVAVTTLNKQDVVWINDLLGLLKNECVILSEFFELQIENIYKFRRANTSSKYLSIQDLFDNFILFHEIMQLVLDLEVICASNINTAKDVIKSGATTQHNPYYKPTRRHPISDFYSSILKDENSASLKRIVLEERVIEFSIKNNFT